MGRCSYRPADFRDIVTTGLASLDIFRLGRSGFFILPFAVGIAMRHVQEYLSDKKLMGLALVLVFGTLAGLSGLVCFDIFITETMFTGDSALPFLRIGYPVITIVFGFSFIVEALKLKRSRRK